MIAALLILSGFNAAGEVGQSVYGFLYKIFGVGFWLLPIALLLLSASLFGKKIKHQAGLKTGAAVVFFFSGLGIISFVSHTWAGKVGDFIKTKLASVVDVYATFIIFLALLLISLVIIFEDRLFSLSWSWPSLTLPHFGIGEKIRDKSKEMREKKSERQESRNTNQESRSKKQEDTVRAGESTKADSTSSDIKKSTGKTKKSKKSGNATGSLFGGSKKTSGDYTPPPADLLDDVSGEPGAGDVKAKANLIKRTFENFNIDVEMDEVSIGPTVTRYSFKPAAGVKLSKITNLQNNLELALAAHPVRIEAPIPGKSLVGIEVPNSDTTMVSLAEMVKDKRFKKSDEALEVALGKSVSGEASFDSIGGMPHLLIAGATGAGKSVTIHSLITSLLYRNGPEELKLIMVDPKRVELTLYDGIPHLLTPVITSAKKAILALKWAAKEMERRYDLLEDNKVRDIESYHKNVGDDQPAMPYVVIIIDELADLMSAYPKELEGAIVRLAQMSRAVGIHLVISTQRPSVNVITGLIKANVPARIALQVSSQVDSRTILDSKGAEELLGAGDMLYQSGDMSQPIRLQSSYISESEVKDVVEFLKEQYEDELPDQVDIDEKDENTGADRTIFDIAEEAEEEDDRDEKYEEALQTVISADKASTSYLQRKLRVGYSRAARIMDQLEENGIISEKNGTKPREVLVKPENVVNGKAGGAEGSRPDEDNSETDGSADQEKERAESVDETADPDQDTSTDEVELDENENAAVTKDKADTENTNPQATEAARQIRQDNDTKGTS